jgi:adenylate kinase family enzyme
LAGAESRNMSRLTIVVSGPVGAGKTELATRLADAFAGHLVRTRPVLEQEYHVHQRAPNRGRLQDLGDQLDRETGGRWVADAVLEHTKFFRPSGVIVVDAVRRQSQIDELRALVTPRVFHIHVTASENVLIDRYRTKQATKKDEELPSFAQVRANRTEAQIEELASRANMRINTGRWWTWATFARARLRIQRANLWSRRYLLARAAAAGVLVVAAIVVVLFGAPLLDVTQLGRTTALVVVYVLFVIVMWLLIAWGFSGQSPVGGLPRRLTSATRAGDEAER